MPQVTGDNLGLERDWDLGTTYKTGMDANLLLLDRVVHLSVIDRGLTVPPGAPTAGDRYIIAAGGSGSWAGQDNNIAVYTGSVWAFVVPKVGWVAYIEDENVLSVWKGASWAAGVAMG